MKEIVRSKGREYRLPSRVVDDITWDLAYKKGYREPNHQLPVLLWQANTATGWTTLICYSHKHGLPCFACLDKWQDQLWDDFHISGGEHDHA